MTSVSSICGDNPWSDAMRESQNWNLIIWYLVVTDDSNFVVLHQKHYKMPHMIEVVRVIDALLCDNLRFKHTVGFIALHLKMSMYDAK